MNQKKLKKKKPNPYFDMDKRTFIKTVAAGATLSPIALFATQKQKSHISENDKKHTVISKKPSFYGYIVYSHHPKNHKGQDPLWTILQFDSENLILFNYHDYPNDKFNFSVKNGYLDMKANIECIIRDGWLCSSKSERDKKVKNMNIGEIIFEDSYIQKMKQGEVFSMPLDLFV